ncbi:MAG: amino acid permease [Deltaproteobacteria bacterium]|nr:MAG: amino acid permease [Deltaproteobacteria bacterium]
MPDGTSGRDFTSACDRDVRGVHRDGLPPTSSLPTLVAGLKDESTTSAALGLPELIAIGVGGMIGGGIFSILGMAAKIAGHAAFLAFVLGCLVATAAGYSYVRLALTFRDDGASYTYLEHAFPKHPNVAGIAGWTVIVGYVGTLALYAFTFGAYAAHFLGEADQGLVRPVLSAGILLFFMVVNLLGVRATGRTEDLVVYTKIVLLGLFCAAGLTSVSVTRLTPLFDRGWTSPFVAGALVFVAFEGFQLITNAVTEIRDPDRNVPRGIYGSIWITSAIYVGVALVALGSMDVDRLVAAEEYALAVAAEPALGHAGSVLVDVAAMLATSSAIGATLLGASRMLAEMATERRVPRAFSHRSRQQVPWVAVVAMTALGLAFSALGTLEVIATFSSLTFLLVSIAVSVANLRLRARTGSRPSIVVAGLLLMSSTVVLLLRHLGAEQPRVLVTVVSLFVAIAVVEWRFFERTHRTSTDAAP